MLWLLKFDGKMDDDLLKIAYADWTLRLSPGDCPVPARRESAREGYARWYRNSREYHPWPELFLVVNGREDLGWEETVVSVETGTALLIAPYQVHAYLFPPGPRRSDSLWISLRETVTSVMYYKKGTPGTALPESAHCGTHEGALPLMIDAWNELVRLDEGESLYPLKKEKLRILARAAILQLGELLLRRNEPEDPGELAVMRIKSFIDAHPRASYTLAELADLAGYSKYHFHRLFLRHTGKTPRQYVGERRVAWAYELLRRGSSCKAAASELGFRDASSFSRWFKEAMGTTPGSIAPIG